MAKTKKLKVRRVEGEPIVAMPVQETPVEYYTRVGQGALITLSNDTKYKECEWCFQIDDGEPVVFASTKDNYLGESAKISFTLTNGKNSDLTFRDKTGRVFKMFARNKQS